MNRYKTMIKGDLKNVLRDGILIMTIIAPILISILLKFLVPLLQKYLFDNYNYDISKYYDLFISFTLILMAMLIGCMTAFIVIEEKDEGLLTYFTITPLGKNGYLLYRLITPLLINFIFSLILIPWIGLIEIQFFHLLFVVLLTSIEAILFALFLVVFAKNRVEGLALSKGLAFLIIIPIIDRVTNFKFNFIYYIVPTFYVGKVFETFTFNYLTIIGLIVHIIYLLYFYHLFMKKYL